MNKPLLSPLLAVIFVSLAGCDRKSADVPPAPEQQNQVVLQTQTQPQQPDVAQPTPETAAPPVENPPPGRQAVVQEKRRAAYAPEQGNYEVFYNDLEQDGDWIQTDTYGYVWHPRVASDDRNWRPYQYGRWVYTESGWAWVSDERFGWATYHYGRWTELGRVGWVWVPGSQWAPAWVSWRNGNDYVGWAPLPPEARVDRDRHDLGRNVDSEYRIGAGNYMFVQIAQFRSPRMKDVVVDRSQNTTIINQTTNITDITDTRTVVVNRNNREERPAVINQGPQADMIAARTRMPVQKLMLTNEQPAARTTVVNGDKLEIAAPALTMPAGGAPNAPRHVKEKLATATVVEPGAPAVPAGQPAAVVTTSPARPPQSQPAALKPGQPWSPKPTPESNVRPMPTSTPEPKAAPIVASTPERKIPSIATPTPESKATPLPTATPEPKATPMPSAKPAPKAAPVVTSTPEPKPTLMPAAAVEPKATSTPQPKAAPIATATPEPKAPPVSKATPAPRIAPVNVQHTPLAADRTNQVLSPASVDGQNPHPPRQPPVTHVPPATTATPVPSPN